MAFSIKMWAESPRPANFYRTECCPYKIAAEQKARLTYDNILRLSDDPDVNNVIRFLREREVVHFQRFGECLELCKDKMNRKNVYFTNPAFDPPAPQPRTK